MSRIGLCVLLLLLPFGPRPVRAWSDEPPAPAPPPAATPPAAPPAPATPQAAPPASGKPEQPTELAKPAQAWRDLQQLLSDPAKRRGNALEEGAKAYLTSWENSKREPASEDLHWLGMFLNAAKRGPEALPLFEKAALCETLLAPQRALSAAAWTNQMAVKARDGSLGGAAAASALTQVEAWQSLAQGSQLAQILTGKAFLLDAAGRTDDALEAFVAAAEANPDLAPGMTGQAVRLLLEHCVDLAQIEPARAKLKTLMVRFTAAQQQVIDKATKTFEAETNAAKQPPLAAAIKQAQANLVRLSSAGRPLHLLGEAAPAWTLERALGKGQALSDYQGKVVVLDFWATWCPWCIKSFPALRDLLRDYAGKDLVVVGVTTSSTSVYDQRYDLDDDLKAKATGTVVKPALMRPKPPAALAPEANEAAKAAFDKATADFPQALAAYKTAEQAVLATFIANHAMTWDVVVIAEDEPAPKYALSGWPHCVVIDRQGRIRHLKSGALLREKPEAVAAFRKVLDGLLAEPAN